MKSRSGHLHIDIIVMCLDLCLSVVFLCHKSLAKICVCVCLSFCLYVCVCLCQTRCIAILYRIVTTQHLDTDTVYQVYLTSLARSIQPTPLQLAHWHTHNTM